MRYISPLRYPGGKARLASFLDRAIRGSGLVGCHYVEPYAGGAGAALGLLWGETVALVHINDASPAICAFWKAVLESNSEFCDRVADVPLDIDTWHAQRLILTQPAEASELDLGFAAFYLNRTNRSGIIGSGGVIGGLAQEGEWKMDARFSRDALIERIRWVGKHRDRIRITGRDALALLGDLDESIESFIYLDPPYYHNAERLYDQWYQPEDHAAICQAIKKLSHPWIVSYDDCREVRELYKGTRSCDFTLRYSAARSYRGAEVVFVSRRLTAMEKWLPGT